MSLFNPPHGGLYIGSVPSDGTPHSLTLNGGLVCGSLTVCGLARVTHFVKAAPYVLPPCAKECAGMSACSSTLPGVSVAEWEEDFWHLISQKELA